MLQIRELPTTEQPAHRLASIGPMALSDAELLSVMLRMKSLETAIQLLLVATSLEAIFNATHQELRLWGLTPRQIELVVASRELAHRITAPRQKRDIVTNAADIMRLVAPEMRHFDQEHFRVICLDTRLGVQYIHEVYVGTVNSILIRTAEVFKEPIRRNSRAIAVVHNHPSGDPSPSPEDILVTTQII